MSKVEARDLSEQERRGDGFERIPGGGGQRVEDFPGSDLAREEGSESDTRPEVESVEEKTGEGEAARGPDDFPEVAFEELRRQGGVRQQEVNPCQEHHSRKMTNVRDPGEKRHELARPPLGCRSGGYCIRSKRAEKRALY